MSTDEIREKTATDDPWIGLAKIKGSDVIYTEHKGRQIEVSISPKGSNVRVHVDGEEWKP